MGIYINPDNELMQQRLISKTEYPFFEIERNYFSSLVYWKKSTSTIPPAFLVA